MRYAMHKLIFYMMIFMFTSIANAAEHFSFSGVDLSFTPQQMASRGIELWRNDRSGGRSSDVSSSVKFGNNDDMEIDHCPFDYSKLIERYSNIRFVNIQLYAFRSFYSGGKLIDGKNLIEKIFSLSKDDIETAENNFFKLASHYQNNNDKYKLYIDRVSYRSKQPDVRIEITYITMPGFKQKPLYLFAYGNSTQLQYVPEIFNQRYGKGNDLIDNHGLDIYWENDKEIAICGRSDAGIGGLMILDKELYKAMVRFVAPEVRRIAAEQKAKAKAAEEAKKGGI